MTVREIETINETFVNFKSNIHKLVTIFMRYENGESSTITTKVENLTIFTGTGLVIIRNGKYTTIIPCEYIVQIEWETDDNNYYIGTLDEKEYIHYHIFKAPKLKGWEDRKKVEEKVYE